MAGTAAITIVVSMTLWSGLPARIAAHGLAPASPQVAAPAPAPPEQPATAGDLPSALSAAVLVKGSCGPGCGSLGAAVAVSDTELLTAAHVVGESGTAVIVTESGDGMLAQVVASDPVRDLALLRTATGHRLPAVTLRSDPPVIGEGAHAVGNPEGERRISDGRVTDFLDIEADGVMDVQTDADIDLGNSGGPLLDDQGRLLGIVVKEHEFDDTIGWATASSEVAAFLSGAMGAQPELTDPGFLPGAEEYERLLEEMFRDLADLPQQ